ncbi:MAG TPA: alanine dehydrogenase [Armatimonadetes bacterium]|nr:alanine dehydrogenase [Armatimonadota bacterium]
MVVGVPKEIKDGENRVALTPAGAYDLVNRGHTVLIQRGAGLGSGLTDEEYRSAGATLVDGPEEIYQRAELVVKVKEPLEPEYPLLREGLILFTYLHLASSESLTQALGKRGVIAIGYETIETKEGKLPALVPMSEVAGRMAMQVGMRLLEAEYGGRGILVGGVPGVPPAEVVVLGCGVVGLNAAKVALGLGAQVTILDINHDRLKYLDDIMHGHVITWYANPLNIEKAALYADLLIGAVLVPGARTPMLVSEKVVRKMKPGAVIVDVSVDQGGCVETTRPTTHSYPTYIVHQVVHYAVPNMPAAVPRTSTFALTNVTLPYICAIADKGLRQALQDDLALARGVNLAYGQVVHSGVAEAFGLDRVPLSEALGW